MHRRENSAPGPHRLSVALGEYDTGWHDPEQSLARARELAQHAKDAGADSLVLPEMCASGFTMDADNFAESANGKSARALAAIAADHHLWLVAGLSIRRDGSYRNSAITFGPDGSTLATYDKQRLFENAGEPAVYAAGTGPCVVRLAGLEVALFICFDLRFPELFREVGPDIDACVIVANWPAVRQRHWEILNRARAIENQFYVVAVNRVGEADGLAYEGGSMILDPWGERCDKQVTGGSLRIGEVSRQLVDRARGSFSVVVDRRAPSSAD